MTEPTGGFAMPLPYATYPAKADSVLIGWDTLARNQAVYLKNILDAFDLDVLVTQKPGSDPADPASYTYIYGVLGVTPRLRTVLLAQFGGPTAQADRETWMNNNARTWLT